MLVYLNGETLPLEEAKISPLDRGFIFGDAVYEVVRFWKGRPYRLEEHVARLGDGLSALRIEVPAQVLAEVSPKLVDANGLSSEDAIVYLQISRGPAPRTHAFPQASRPTVFAFARASDPPPTGPSRLILTADERWSRCDIKAVQLLPNVLAAQAAREAGMQDAVLVRDGLALETTRGNLFVRGADGILRTAPNSPRILPGVTRQAALEAAAALSIPVEERAVTVEELFAAREAFLTSTTLLCQAIAEVDDVDRRAPARGVPGCPLSGRGRLLGRRRLRVRGLDHRRDPAARGESTGHDHAPGPAGLHAVRENSVDGVLVEDAEVPVGHDVELQRLQLQAGLVRLVSDRQRSEVGKSRLRAHGVVLGDLDGDLVAVVLIRPGLDLGQGRVDARGGVLLRVVRHPGDATAECSGRQPCQNRRR
jgi:D-alanine transaminase